MSTFAMSDPWPSRRHILLRVLLVGAGTCFGSTNQFRGVNWADPRDNFQSGVIYVSGLSSTDTYASASVVADRVVGQFVSKLGSNAVRMPINEATAGSYWETYAGAIDMALTKGRVVLGFWGKASGANPPDMNAWWNMWSTVVSKYGSNGNFYVEVFNEPSGYDKAGLLSLYDQWLKKFPDFPRKRILLDGTGLAWGVPDVGSDERFDSCLLAVHDYTFFAGGDMVTESKWANHIKGYVGGYSDRTVATEWGGPMSAGSKNGVAYQPMDYSKPATNFFEAYIRGISQQLRDWKMGSFYWPGLRDKDWYSLTTRSGTGSSIDLGISNQSGVDRMRYSWVDTTPTSMGPPGRAASNAPMFEVRRSRSMLEISFAVPADGFRSIRVSDARGMVVRKLSIDASSRETGSRSLDLSGLPGGVYAVDLVGDGRILNSTRILIDR